MSLNRLSRLARHRGAGVMIWRLPQMPVQLGSSLGDCRVMPERTPSAAPPMPGDVGSARMASPRQLMLAAVAIGFTLRAAFGLFYWVDKPLTHDEKEYLALADSLAVGRGLRYPTEETSIGPEPQRFGRAPLYPVFLATIGVGTPNGNATLTELRRLKLVQAALGALGVWLIGCLAARAAGIRAGMLAAATAAVYPPLVWMPAYVLSETLFSGIALAGTLLLARVIDDVDRDVTTAHHQGRSLLLAGVVAGLATLVRPVMLFFLAAAAGWLALRHAPRLALAFALSAILVIAPWTARNLAEHGRFILIASEGGITFWTGNHPLAIGEGDMAANPRIRVANEALRRRYPTSTPEDLEAIYYREALTYIATHHTDWALLVARKFFYLVVPIGPSYTATLDAVLPGFSRIVRNRPAVRARGTLALAPRVGSTPRAHHHCGLDRLREPGVLSAGALSHSGARSLPYRVRSLVALGSPLGRYRAVAPGRRRWPSAVKVPRRTENSNGLLRQYFPKNADLSVYTRAELNAVAPPAQ